MTIPNLFNYATSELSQDAFICWLLAWADPACKQAEPALHECAIAFIGALFAAHGKQAPAIEKVEVKRQDAHIDVLCIVNDLYLILIEDKTHTKNHSDQLETYLEIVSRRAESDDFIVPIYFKTYDQSCYKAVLGCGYGVFSRADFLGVLTQAAERGVRNAIFLDFLKHLQAIERRVNAYASKVWSANWGRQAWIGLFMRLQEELGVGKWDYVPNQAGGFMGFWWANQGGDACMQHLQLENETLCFKIRVDDLSRRRALRQQWYQAFKQKAGELGFPALKKPAYFGNGKHMTVLVDANYLRFDGAGLVDVAATVAYLRKVETVLRAAEPLPL
ncbi:PD-(D/E)XK nuclease family protein [Stutzerimonas xanthomarina]|uniref:PD-(D/E)XK nuclease family protein n=1 Tax=Stutzerimonas xanthomarina TaxID=271420 RepID=UPI003AA890CE